MLLFIIYIIEYTLSKLLAQYRKKQCSSSRLSDVVFARMFVEERILRRRPVPPWHHTDGAVVRQHSRNRSSRTSQRIRPPQSPAAVLVDAHWWPVNPVSINLIYKH